MESVGKIKKIGNSLGIIINPIYLKANKLKENDFVVYIIKKAESSNTPQGGCPNYNPAEEQQPTTAQEKWNKIKPEIKKEKYKNKEWQTGEALDEEE